MYFFPILHTPYYVFATLNMSLRTPGVHLPQVEDHCSREPNSQTDEVGLVITLGSPLPAGIDFH
jgi:hypothetical protein